MKYSAQYILKVLSKARCCLGDKGEKRAIKWRNGEDCDSDLSMMESSLYIYGLSNYGISDVPTEEHRNYLINALLDLSCGCGNIDTQEIIDIPTDYWQDGYTVNGDYV